MGVNRGKQFEDQVRVGFERVPETSVLRLFDPQGGQVGISNICDFVVYHYPHQFFIECKSCHGNTLSIHTNNPKKKYGAISNTQWEGLLKESYVTGIIAGVVVWFIDHDETLFLPIQVLQSMRDEGKKSVNIHTVDRTKCYMIPGKKRRVLFDYDFTDFVG